MKKRRMVITLLLVVGLFGSSSSSISTNLTHSANSFITLSGDPIDGNH